MAWPRRLPTIAIIIAERRTDYYTYIGAGGFGTLHLGLKDADLPDGLGFMSNTDWYIGLGAGFYSYTGVGMAVPRANSR
jgi:hypothetical protein